MNASIIEHLRSAGRLDRIFIDGEWVLPAGQARTSVIDPSTEEPVAEIALGSAQDVAAAVAAARRAFATWSVSSAQSRASLLDRVHGLILERAELFAQAISLEMGAAIGFARSTQVPSRRSTSAWPATLLAQLSRSLPIGATRPSCARPSACAA